MAPLKTNQLLAVEPDLELFPRQTQKLGDIFERAGIAKDLALVERHLERRASAARSSVLSASGLHTVAAGGKRLRAALVLISAHFGTYDQERALHPAAAIELLHAASLVHDDLVDHTLQRRGRITVHARWSSTAALMLGDYFFGAAANELSGERDPRIIRYYADAARTIVEGELHPVTQVAPLDTALEQYRRKIGAKTAVLFQAACQSGMAVAGGTQREIDALAQFGYNLGMAFQIIDDILDFTGNEVVLGKPAGNDVREGTLTAPLIYAVAYGNSAMLNQLAENPYVAPEHVPEVVREVISSGGIEYAMRDAVNTAHRALDHLAMFPNSHLRTACSDLLQFVLTRTS